MGQWEGRQVGRTVWGEMRLRSWQNIKGRHREKQDGGPGESKGQEDLGSGCHPKVFSWQCIGGHDLWL